MFDLAAIKELLCGRLTQISTIEDMTTEELTEVKVS